MKGRTRALEEREGVRVRPDDDDDSSVLGWQQRLCETTWRQSMRGRGSDAEGRRAPSASAADLMMRIVRDADGFAARSRRERNGAGKAEACGGPQCWQSGARGDGD